jgi:hypothetical protein
VACLVEDDDDPAASASSSPFFQDNSSSSSQSCLAAEPAATMTPFLTLALALSMPVLSMAAAVTKPLHQTKPYGLEVRQVDETGETEESDVPDSTGIVGGTTASTGEFPYIVSLSKSGSHFCGGVLLNAYTVITAAHCSVGQSASSVKVRAGTLVSHISTTWMSFLALFCKEL